MVFRHRFNNFGLCDLNPAYACYLETTCLLSQFTNKALSKKKKIKKPKTLIKKR